MTKPDFVYVTYIATTPEKIWNALVDPDMARRYWMDPTVGCARVNVSDDWQPGSRWEHRRADDMAIVDIAGHVVETDPPRRLVISWARPDEADDAAKCSRVSFDIDAVGNGLVRLTVTHDDLARDPQMLAGVSGGWPKVLSNLKTLLETGNALPRSAAA